MAINFCRTHHCPRINSSKVSMDGYEAENLVSIDDSRRKKGFLAASFISPPVEITLSFPYSVDVSHIILGLRNGSQKSTALKIYSRVMDSGNEPGNFHLIGAYDNVTESKLCLVNNRYKPTKLFNLFSYNRPVTSDCKSLYPRLDSYVCRISALKIRLLKTSNSTVPVLSELQVWGQPGTGCSLQQRKKIYDTELESMKMPSSGSWNKNSVEETPEKDYIDKDFDESDVPAEFLDAITYEVMSQPVLLPSGNSVDCSTIEKYVETSSAWGRLPGDPFTGVPFGPGSQPVTNVELKLRIDTFWLSHPSMQSGGRCTGAAHPSRIRFNSDTYSKSSQITNKNDLGIDKAKDFSYSAHYDVSKRTYTAQDKTKNLIKAQANKGLFFHSRHNEMENSIKISYNKCKSICEVQHDKSKHCRDTNSVSENWRYASLKRTYPTDNAPVSAKFLKRTHGSQLNSQASNVDHMQALASSLELGLKDVLKDKQSYIDRNDILVSESDLCSHCCSVLSQGAYRLPCTHILCRSCLVNETRIIMPVCKICNISYSSSDAVRFHRYI